MDRKPTTSITYLIKQLIEEETETKLSKINLRLNAIEKILPVHHYPFGREDRSGEPWSEYEKNELVKQLERWLTYTAGKHGRSIGAITSRLDKVAKEGKTKGVFKEMI